MRFSYAAALAATIVCAAPLAAQAGAAADYDLPAQDLADRLRAIARISGRDLLFEPAVAAGRRAAPLKGRLTPTEALAATLADSGLVVEERGGALLIRARPASAMPAEGAAEEAGITITGSRIRGAASAAPVVSTRRRALEEAGIGDLAGYARILPQNFTGGQNPGVAGGGNQGGSNNINNSTTLNLRGLGADATLTLVNGHRLAYDALNQGVDISAVPLIAVERIEVIADGSSALYGSDAVGGVANVILRRDHDGLATSLRLAGTTDGGGFQQQVSAIAGTRWTTGGFMIAADHNRASAIRAEDRDYARGLDGSATLIPAYDQFSLVVAGHQALGERLTFELDLIASDRRSEKATVFLTSGDVFTNGQLNRPSVLSYSVSPRLRARLGDDWEATLGASYGESETVIRTRRFSNRVESGGRATYRNRLATAEAGLEGPLFAASGGSARLAVGGGYRAAGIDIAVAQRIGAVNRVTRDADERRGTWFAYGELSVPLVGEANAMPLVDALSVSAALRYERIAGIDAVATPKLGLIWSPHPALTLSATWGRAFKAPTLNQVNQLRSGNLLPAALFTPPAAGLPAGSTVLLIGGTDPDVRAERATSWTASAEIRPPRLAGLRLRLSYFEVDYRDRVAFAVERLGSALADPLYRAFVTFGPTPGEVRDLVATLPQGLVNQTGQPFDPARVAAVVDDSLRNVSRERVRGLDLQLDHETGLGRGRLTLTGGASYLESERQISAGQPVRERAGRIFNPPHWRARGGASFAQDGFALSAFMTYVGGTLDDRFAAAARIPAFVTLDATLGLRSRAARGPLAGAELRLIALNLLDARPAPIRNTNPADPPYDSLNQSPVGRVLGLQLSKRW